MSNHVEDAAAYLRAVSVATANSTLAELPLRLTEIARNLEAIARGAEIALTRAPEVDDF
jgi:hypothetical protein